MAGEADRAAERAARLSYGRLVAHLARRFRDVAAAEDALGEAFATALEQWPRAGVPDNPDGWLLTAARNRLIDGARRARRAAEAVPTLTLAAQEDGPMPTPMPDDRLALMYACAHPSIDPAMHAPLMLQVVLGLDAARIASAFLVAPSTMGQRLVRAKARIREAGLAFERPEPEDLSGRQEAFREAIYAAFAAGWDDPAEAGAAGLAREAIWLAEVLNEIAPGEPETLGLLALMLHAEARRPARRSPEGAYVPFAEQDPRLWDAAAIRRAEAMLAAAAGHLRPGRFQTEAAIQSARVAGRRAGRDLSVPLLALHRALVAFAPTIGNTLALAAAIDEAEGPQGALVLIRSLPADRLATHQPAAALTAHLLARLGRPLEAAEAYRRAAGLSADPAVRGFLLAKAEGAARQPALSVHSLGPKAAPAGSVEPGDAGPS